MIVWKRKVGRFSNGYRGYIHELPLMSVDWDGGCPPKGKPWKLTTELPLIEITEKHFSSHDIAKAGADVVLERWLKKSGLRQDDGQ